MKQIQIINENQENCSEAIKKWNMEEIGFDYHIVAVFGAQSSGKSTLLNHLFSTEFDVMDAKGGRGQTTKGIWMSKDAHRNILVMDVEGTDGRERGEDQDFERKSALFSLATAEVLIINMFEQSVGLYNGANMSLLRTVMEVNLQLFQLQSSSKTCLLFVLRDSTGQTPLETLSATLKTDLEKIWMTLSKPSGKETALISDYFDFSFATVAHKIFVPEKFNSDLNMLKKKITDKDDPNYLIRVKHHKGIPADGFPLFAQNIWSKIIENRDLDLPSQQQLLAQFRCEEIGNSIFDGFLQKIKLIKPTLDSGKVARDFGSLGNLVFGDSIDAFNKSASRYHKPTYEKKKLEFSARLFSNLQILFLQQLRNLHRDALELFSGLLKNGITEKKKTFGQRLSEAKEKALEYHLTICLESKLNGSDWSFEDYSNVFKSDIEALLSQKRSDELKRVTIYLQKLTVSKMSDPLAKTMSICGPELWNEVFNQFQSALTDLVQVTNDRTYDIGIVGDELMAYQSLRKFQAWNEFLRLINEELTDTALLEKMRRRFDSIFRYDDKGLPRIWNPTDDIESIFQKSKESVEKMLSLLEIFDADLLETLDNEIRIHEDFTKDALVFITTSRKADITKRFAREEDSLFLEAKRATVSNKAEIPTWFFVLTIVLGWNEFLAILRNPFLAAFLLMLLGAIYLVYYTNLAGPILHIAKATTGEVVKQTKEGMKKRGFNPDQLVEWLMVKTKVFLIYDDEKKNENIEMKNM